MQRKYTREFLVSLRGAKELPESFCAPPDVKANTVSQVVMQKKKSTKSNGTKKEDYLSADERAKLEEIQRIVRQQQHPVWLPKGGVKVTGSPSTSPKQEKQERKQIDTPEPKAVTPKKSSEETSPQKPLNPNAAPFTPSSPTPPPPPAGNEDDDDVWSSEIALPPMPATKNKKVEGDEWRLKQRQKQIRIGIQTVGYKNYLRSKEIGFEVDAEQPRIPNVYQVCSKRAWDGQVRRWRQLLHNFDELTDVLWNEDEAKDIHKITQKQQVFKEKVRKQQLQTEINVMREIMTPTTDVLMDCQNPPEEWPVWAGQS